MLTFWKASFLLFITIFQSVCSDTFAQPRYRIIFWRYLTWKELIIPRTCICILVHISLDNTWDLWSANAMKVVSKALSSQRVNWILGGLPTSMVNLLSLFITYKVCTPCFGNSSFHWKPTFAVLEQRSNIDSYSTN